MLLVERKWDTTAHRNCQSLSSRWMSRQDLLVEKASTQTEHEWVGPDQPAPIQQLGLDLENRAQTHPPCWQRSTWLLRQGLVGAGPVPTGNMA